MRGCHRCQRPFGLTRRYVYRFSGGHLAFCSQRCKEAYRNEQAQTDPTSFFNWLWERVCPRAR